jgi:hypothetical protein
MCGRHGVRADAEHTGDHDAQDRRNQMAHACHCQEQI